MALTIIGLWETVSPDLAYSAEETVAHCQGQRNTVVIYKQEGKVFMRASNRNEGSVWLNNAPVKEESNSEGTYFVGEGGGPGIRVLDLVNIEAKQKIRTFVPRNGNSCSITIGKLAPEQGTLLKTQTTQEPKPTSESIEREQQKIENALASWGKSCQNELIDKFGSDVSMADIRVEVGATFQQSVDAGKITYTDLRRDGASFNWSVPKKNMSGYCNTDGRGNVTEFKFN